MQDIHLLCMPRSGSSMAIKYIIDRSEKLGASLRDLGEFFYPNSKASVSSQFGVSSKDSNFIDHRIALYDVLTDQMRVVKLLYQHQNTAGIMHCLGDEGSMLLVLDRRNQLDQLLSWLIADRYGIWNVESHGIRDYKHDMKSFHADLNSIRFFADTRRGFDRLLSSMHKNRPNLHQIWYESLASDLDDLSPEICDHLGIDKHSWLKQDQDGFFGQACDDRPAKLLSLQEKQDVVLNWQVSYEHYQKLISDQI